MPVAAAQRSSMALMTGSSHGCGRLTEMVRPLCHGLSIARCLAACVPDSINVRLCLREEARKSNSRGEASLTTCAPARQSWAMCGFAAPSMWDASNKKSRVRAAVLPSTVYSIRYSSCGGTLARYCTVQNVLLTLRVRRRALRAVRALDSTETAVIHPISPCQY